MTSLACESGGNETKQVVALSPARSVTSAVRRSGSSHAVPVVQVARAVGRQPRRFLYERPNPSTSPPAHRAWAKLEASDDRG